MLIKPKSVKFKFIQKNRILRVFRNNPFLAFGNSGAQTLRPIHVTGGFLGRLRLFLKKATKNFDKTKRFCWFKVFPHLPLTKKSTGLRMGKGKGKFKFWFTNIHGGSIIFEFKNLRPGASSYFIKQTGVKLGICVIPVFESKILLPNPYNTNKSVKFLLYH